MKNYIRNLSIKKKLVFYSYLIITPILLLISGGLFLKNYRSDMSSRSEYYLRNVENLADGLDTLLSSIVEFGTYICINNDIRNILLVEDADSLNQDSQLWIHEAPMRTLQDLVALNGQIKTIAIYPENGVRPYLRCMDAAMYQDDMDAVRNTGIYQETVAENGQVLFRRVGKGDGETYRANRTEKIVMYREIFDWSRKNRLGYLVIGASADRYMELCENSLPSDDAGILVFSKDGQELLRCGVIADVVSEQAAAWFEDAAWDGNELSCDGYRIYRSTSGQNGIIVYEILPGASIHSQISAVAAAPLALLLGFLVGLYPILVLVSNIVSKPLKELCLAMDSFKKGDFTQKVEVHTGDEVGEAAACFNLMVDDMKELIETNYVMELREKESELRALQAQINPHFLYNTLDSLYWRAENSGNEEIAEDILALSQLFRLVLGQGSGIVSIRREQEMIEQYLHIQKMRFSENLDYEIVMEDAILEVQIPKLILQPFVENAVVHGFERAGENGFIRVEGKREGQQIVFTIEDNGVGMSREQTEAIWDVPDSQRYKGQRVGRYAIKNVRERLELKYHENFRLEIESSEGVGTKVMIAIPYNEGMIS